LSVGSLKIDPNDENTLYLGTGEGNITCSSYGGVGIYKSTDGGDTWTGPFGGDQFGSNRSVVGIEVDRTNSDLVLVSSTRAVTGIGCTWGPTFPPRGIFRSTDGGATWVKITPDNLHMSNIMQDPLADNVFWTAGWHAGYDTDPHHGGLLKSTDRGQTWTQVAGTGGLPAQDDTWGRAWITGTVNGAGTESVLYLANGQRDGSVWRSDDSGATWSPIPAASGYCTPRCETHMPIHVEPGDPDVLYLGGGRASEEGVLPSQMMRSTDGGATFVDIVRSADMTTAMHPYVHAITTFPGQDNHLWVGTGGGIWRSIDRGTNWINLNSNLAITQFRSCDLDPTDPDRAYGGTLTGTMGWTGTPAWSHLDFYEGGFALIDPSTPDNLVHTYINARGEQIGVAYTTAGFATTQGFYNFSGAPANGISIHDRVLSFPPIHLDHGVTDTLYFGTHRLYRAPDFFAVGGGFVALAGGADLSGGVRAISAIETYSPTPGVPAQLIFTGSSDGAIYRSTDGGDTFALGEWWSLYISDILVDRRNPQRVFASRSGYSGVPGRNVLRSLDGGVSWAVAGTGIPNVPVNALVIDPLVENRIWAGTYIGVFVSEDGADTWSYASNGMPEVAVFDMKARDNGRIIACTHGRGAFVADLRQTLLFTDDFESGNTSVWSGSTP
ncbi:MAG: hypothetical protein MI919_22420, partial [Holophagales bacterium]|nr:hypothetical protein [Holophagales bacterium]